MGLLLTHISVSTQWKSIQVQISDSFKFKWFTTRTDFQNSHWTRSIRLYDHGLCDEIRYIRIYSQTHKGRRLKKNELEKHY